MTDCCLTLFVLYTAFESNLARLTCLNVIRIILTPSADQALRECPNKPSVTSLLAFVKPCSHLLYIYINHDFYRPDYRFKVSKRGNLSLSKLQSPITTQWYVYIKSLDIFLMISFTTLTQNQ